MSNTETTITIAVIKPNNFKFTKEQYYNDIPKLQQDISSFIEIKQILFNDMMESIVTLINLTPELIGHTSTCFETSKNIYQLCFVGTENNNSPSTSGANDDSTDNGNILSSSSLEENNICEFLSGETVHGNAVFINSMIGIDNTCLPDNITLEMITQILYSKFVHKGIYISPNDNEIPIEYNYFNHPIEYYNITTEDSFENYKIIDINFLEFNLCAIIEINPSNEIVNKPITRLYGKQKINGGVLLISKSTYEYHDLSLELYKKIMELSFGSLKSRDLNDDEKNDKESENKLPIVMNKYTILQNRYTNLKNICYSCAEPFTEAGMICGGCYRIKYHSLECQKNDWNNHKNDCLYNKEFMNKKN